MAIIIDTNCLPSVFSKSAQNHEEFEPVLRWILEGKGLIIFGGTKYKKELSKIPKFLPIIRELKSIGKVIEGNSIIIDEIQEKIEEMEEDGDFDDPHLPAIVIETKCRIICSLDRRSIRFVTNSKFYPPRFPTPVYYTSRRNIGLLSDQYVSDDLKPLCKISKSQSMKIKKMLR